jgi:transposase
MPPAAVAPAFFPPEVRAQTTALACALPEQADVPLARWSCAELAAALISLGIVVGIAASTIWRWLHAERIKPWRFRMWQQVHDPQFLPRAREILTLYAQAAQLLAEDIWVICVDEKTSIQARQGIDPPRPAMPGSSMQIAPRYQRKGALHLFALLSVADGLVQGCCRTRKRFGDWQVFFWQCIVPEALRRGVRDIRLILDNGPTHAPKRLAAWLDAECEAHELPFRVQVVWLPKYASWLDQLEIWFSILQRKVLRPNHFPDRTALEQRLLASIDHYNDSAKPIQWSYTVEQLVEKFGTD